MILHRIAVSKLWDCDRFEQANRQQKVVEELMLDYFYKVYSHTYPSSAVYIPCSDVFLQKKLYDVAIHADFLKTISLYRPVDNRFCFIYCGKQVPMQTLNSEEGKDER